MKLLPYYAALGCVLWFTPSTGVQSQGRTRPPIYRLPVHKESFAIEVDGKKMRGQLVRVMLRRVRFRVVFGQNQSGKTEALASLAQRCGAIAAINGSYFQAYNRGDFKPPVMNQICDGHLFPQGAIGTMLGFGAGNQPLFERAPIATELWRRARENGESNSWGQVEQAIGCGPRLVSQGQISLDARGEGFRDPKVTTLSTARSAIGVTRGEELVMVVSSGTMRQMAALMKGLGCRDAMNLDGGASSGLWTQGTLLRRPGRALSNALMVLPTN